MMMDSSSSSQPQTATTATATTAATENPSHRHLDSTSTEAKISENDSITKKEDILDKKEEEEEEDALDAYMKSLGNSESETTKKRPSSPSIGRLDVENEDEATSHWETQQQQQQQQQHNDYDDNNNDNDDSNNELSQSDSAREAAYMLESTFHRASNQQQQLDEDGKDHRQVNIQLQRVQHDQMNYANFKKCFLVMDKSNKYRNSHEGNKWRKENHVYCNPPLDPIYDFAELKDIVPDQILEWNTSKNITQPTTVQSQTLGVALAGKDVIVTAATGSGKTLTYLWPLATHLMANQGADTTKKSRSLILVPTRELALQVEQVAKSLFAALPITPLAITGGNLGRYQLSQKLQSTKPHCVIATPGRLLDVLSAQQKSKQEWLLPNITFLVMDEADKMIQLGFANQVTQILQNLRPDRQSVLVSATFDSRLQRRCQEWMNQPSRISVGKTGQSSKHVTQHVICLPNTQSKIDFLKESLPTFVDVGRTLVFCATRQGVEALASELRTVLPVETLHGDRHPTDRKAALKAFTKGDVKVLVATDVAGRGLDIPQVSQVINYDPGKNWETHVHRIGRAGRLSAEDQQQHQGSAYTLLLPTNVDFAKALIRAYEREDRPVPQEVRALADRRQSGGGGNDGNTRKHSNKSGLGFAQDDHGSGPPKRSRWS